MHAVDVDIRFSAPVRDGNGAARNVWYMDIVGDLSLIHVHLLGGNLDFTYTQTVEDVVQYSLGILFLSTLPHFKHRHGDFQPPVARFGTVHSPTST
jgi:hypothetical protein